MVASPVVSALGLIAEAGFAFARGSALGFAGKAGLTFEGLDFGFEGGRGSG